MLPWRPEREKAGFCRIWFFGGETRLVQRHERGRLLDALNEGQRTATVRTLFDCLTTIMLCQVTEVEDVSPESVEAFDTEEAERAEWEEDGGQQERWQRGR